MNIPLLKQFKRAKIDREIPGKRVNYDRMCNITERAVNEAGRSFCLDFGAGNLHDDRFTTIDIDPVTNPDLVIDIRVLFAGSDHYRELSDRYPDAKKITGGYMLIRMLHAIEHMEWIYQRAMFQWLFSILGQGGKLFLATPNVEYAAKIYVQNLERLEAGKFPAFPRNEHPDFINTNRGYDVVRWFNFKLYSGCSWGDFHHCMYDRYWLVNVLAEVGFTDIMYADGNTLYVLASKPSTAESDVDHSVRNVIAEWADKGRGQ